MNKSRILREGVPPIANWSKFNPLTTGKGTNAPYPMCNLINGKWVSAKEFPNNGSVVDPLSGIDMLITPNTPIDALDPFVKAVKSVHKTGLHNPLKNVERYLALGDLSFRLAQCLRDQTVRAHFANCIQRVCPKSDTQTNAEVDVTRKFLENFSGDQVRFLAKGFSVPGDHFGQQSHAYRFPYGATCIISPFNFPMEIPVLQLMGALFMGNHVTLKCATSTSIVMEEWIRLMECLAEDSKYVDGNIVTQSINIINCSGRVAEEFLGRCQPSMTQFTGSSIVAEKLVSVLKGKVRIEDAGFDWKILGPVKDIEKSIEYVAWCSDHDAYAHTGQKCSAQSCLFVHDSWAEYGFYDKIKLLANKRNLKDLTIGPILSHTTEDILGHVEKILSLVSGSKVLFGGSRLEGHEIPSCYGAVTPTAVFVPLKEMIKEENFELCSREIFGPFQIVTQWGDNDLGLVLHATDRMANLTAAVVSDDIPLRTRILANTMNGTTYCGIRARTTGAPQNHWFGPAGDPRAAGIGTPEAIKLVWSCHREIITDDCIPCDWSQPDTA